MGDQRLSEGVADVDLEAVWNAMPTPCAVLGDDNRFLRVNGAAELFFSHSSQTLSRMRLEDLCPVGSRILELVEQARKHSVSLSEYAVEMSWFGHEETTLVDIQTARIFSGSRASLQSTVGILLVIQPRSIAQAMDRSLANRGSSASLTGLSSMLAHEIKNPLAGISGAAQLLEMSLGDGATEMVDLIQEEVGRIRSLLDRVDIFGEVGLPEREPVNIHDVLDQARRAAQAGYGAHVRFREIYDPSLPPVPADRNQLLQVVSNLIKNAAEAVPKNGGEITLRTAYRPGVKIAVSGGGHEGLPLEVLVIDNGPGVPEELRQHIFDPFVTSKSSGTGLGLALVAKIVADHGGVVECLRGTERTTFRLLLPVWTGALPSEEGES